jgi:glycine/D-amino acid oxidase-like deaminating enzyme
MTQTVVIIGGGIVGVCTAYFIATRHRRLVSSDAGGECADGDSRAASTAAASAPTTRVVIVERHRVAGCASGKAGGFLARGWGAQTPTEQLHHVSFDLHETLAAELGIESYRKLVTLEVSSARPQRQQTAGAKHKDRTTAQPDLCPWLNGLAFDAETMDPTTAQVTPIEFITKVGLRLLRTSSPLSNSGDSLGDDGVVGEIVSVTKR